LLDLMVNILIKDLSVHIVLTSYPYISKQPFADRDRTNPIHVLKTSGNTRHYIPKNAFACNPIAIVAIAFAGLTTNTIDLIQWLHNHKIAKIALLDNIDP
ncbi:hypothetical protein CLU79DRAFT_709587, partial [Phycomyces nitens]